MLVTESNAVGESNASPVVAADPEARALLLGRLELVYNGGVSELVLRDRGRPQLEADHLRRGRVSLQQHLPAALVHLGHHLLLCEVLDGGVARASDVVEEEVVVAGSASREERRAPQGAQCADALGARVEGAEAREVLEVAEAVVELNVLERVLRVRDGDGADRRIVDADAVNLIADLVCEHGGFGEDRVEHPAERVGGRGGDDGFGLDGLHSRGRVVGSEVPAARRRLDLSELPLQLHLVRQTLLDGLGQRREALSEGPRVAVCELDPLRRGRVRLALLLELDLPLEPAVEDGAELVPLDRVRVLLDPRDLPKRRLHRERLGVARVHARHERVDAAQEHLLAQDARHPLTDRLVFALGRRRVSNKGTDSGADLAGPREKLSCQAELDHAVGSKQQLELPFASRRTSSLRKRVKFSVVEHPRWQRLVTKDKLVVNAELVGNPDDAGLSSKRVGALLPNKPVLGLVRLDVSSQVIACLGQEHVNTSTVQIVRESGA
mmetsp:Transcript_53010/g.125181  ORF Transcript_53010/g.125181 Transcript_53010/m.125181 type:complete len:495 (-) Transcript_53010:179-1663(-)